MNTDSLWKRGEGKMRKKIIAILLCAGILTGCAGCGSTAAGENQTTATETADAMAETEAEATTGEAVRRQPRCP